MKLLNVAKSATFWLVIVLAALVIVPFVIFGSSIDQWFATLLASDIHKATMMSVIVIALASDPFLPIPSSVLATAAGAMTGWLPATLLATLGLSLGSLLAWGFGRLAGSKALGWWASADELKMVTELLDRYGLYALIALRAVPVFAEVSMMLISLSNRPPSQILAVASLANLGIALVYAAVGAWQFSTNSLIWALAASIALPLAFLHLVRRRFKKLESENQRQTS